MALAIWLHVVVAQGTQKITRFAAIDIIRGILILGLAGENLATFDPQAANQHLAARIAGGGEFTQIPVRNYPGDLQPGRQPQSVGFTGPNSGAVFLSVDCFGAGGHNE